MSTFTVRAHETPVEPLDPESQWVFAAIVQHGSGPEMQFKGLASPAFDKGDLEARDKAAAILKDLIFISAKEIEPDATQIELAIPEGSAPEVTAHLKGETVCPCCGTKPCSCPTPAAQDDFDDLGELDSAKACRLDNPECESCS